MTRSKLFATIAAMTAALILTTGVAFASGWHTIAKRSASGDFAVTAIDATVNHPHQIAVRFSGGSGLVVWACDKGYSIGSWSRNWGRGFHLLPHVRGKDSCDVTASVGGSGGVTVQILAHR